jgi:O-antigen ligase
LDQELRLNGFHNSYAEVLFGSGVIVFVIFFFYYLIQPFVFFVRYVQKHYVSFFPIFIYPFFESNLTSGQFIYWPWMSGVILLYFIRKRMLH